MLSSGVFLALSTVAFSVLLGSSSNAGQADFQDRFVGRWESNKEKSKEYAKEHRDDEMSSEDYFDSLPKICFEFRKTGEAKAMIEIPAELKEDKSLPQSMEGDWKVIEEIDQDQVKMRLMFKVGDDGDSKEVFVEFLDDNTLAFKIEVQPTLVLTRATEKDENKESEPKEEKNKLDK